MAQCRDTPSDIPHGLEFLNSLRLTAIKREYLRLIYRQTCRCLEYPGSNSFVLVNQIRLYLCNTNNCLLIICRQYMWLFWYIDSLMQGSGTLTPTRWKYHTALSHRYNITTHIHPRIYHYIYNSVSLYHCRISLQYWSWMSYMGRLGWVQRFLTHVLA